MAKFDNEEWRTIVGFTMYEVSNLGNVRRAGGVKPLQPCQQSTGYYQVFLRRDGEVFPKLIHRLVGEAFIPNPYKKTQINHLDECKINNNSLNLEWCTPKENCQYGTKPLKARNMTRKAIIAINAKTQEIKSFQTTEECVAYFNTTHKNIVDIANSNRDIRQNKTITSVDGEQWGLWYKASEINANGEEVYTSPSERKYRELIDEFNRLRTEFEKPKTNSAELPKLDIFEQIKEVGREIGIIVENE